MRNSGKGQITKRSRTLRNPRVFPHWKNGTFIIKVLLMAAQKVSRPHRSHLKSESSEYHGQKEYSTCFQLSEKQREWGLIPFKRLKNIWIAEYFSLFTQNIRDNRKPNCAFRIPSQACTISHQYQCPTKTTVKQELSSSLSGILREMTR